MKGEPVERHNSHVHFRLTWHFVMFLCTADKEKVKNIFRNTFPFYVLKSKSRIS